MDPIWTQSGPNPDAIRTHQLRWGAKPPTLIDGFPGGKRPFLHPKHMVLRKTSVRVGSLPGALLLNGSLDILDSRFPAPPGARGSPQIGPRRARIDPPGLFQVR
jgi:hypothetical protein